MANSQISAHHCDLNVRFCVGNHRTVTCLTPAKLAWVFKCKPLHRLLKVFDLSPRERKRPHHTEPVITGLNQLDAGGSGFLGGEEVVVDVEST